MDFPAILEWTGVQKVGKQYLCPFHPDTHPSFSLYVGKDGKERFHCFTCGAKGNVYEFLKQRTGMGFAEAKKFVSGPSSLVVGPKKPSEEYYPIFTYLMDSLGKFPSRASKYLRGRGLPPDGVFSLGVRAVVGKKQSFQLCDDLLNRFSPSDLLDCGLVGKSKKGNFYFKLFDRLLIPWKTRRGVVQFIQGRSLQENSDYRYLNVKASTPIYYLPKPFSQEEWKGLADPKLWIVEGAIDAIATVLLGKKMAIALPSATSGRLPFLAKKIRRLGLSVMIAVDKDQAGKQLRNNLTREFVGSGLTEEQIGLFYLAESKDMTDLFKQNQYKTTEKEA